MQRTDGEGRQPIDQHTIFHIARAADWAAAQADGSYRMSTRGRTLEDVGYIHCSLDHQVDAVAEAHYRDVADLVLLAIDPARVDAEVRYERLDGAPEPFPHIYGPLRVDAVVAVSPFPR